jgi:hypothetical protein
MIFRSPRWGKGGTERNRMARNLRWHRRVTRWHRHFCWLPEELLTNEIAWLTFVERRYWYTGYPGNAHPYRWLHRRIGDIVGDWQ